MSYIPSNDTSPDLPTDRYADPNRSEDGFQTPAATLDARSGIQPSITPTRNSDVYYGGNTNIVSTAPSPSLDRSNRRLSNAEGQEGVALVGSALDGFNEGTNELLDRPSSSAGYASNTLRRLAETQQQPLPPTLSVLTNTSIPKSGSSRAVSPAGWLKTECEELRKKQEELQMNIDGPSRTPVQTDFPPALSMKLLSPTKQVENCIILLHNLGNNEASLENHAQKLKNEHTESAFILLRGLQPIEPGNSGYHWADANGTVDEGFINTSRVILKDIIQDGLMAKCNFHPRDIVILGHSQGGMAALAATACWNCIEFGGVVSFGGPMPGYVQLPFTVKAKTPALIYGATRGDITPNALLQIKENFSVTDHHIPPSGHDTVPLSEEEMAPLLDFFAHRLKREEWKRQAVISLGKNLHCLGNMI